MLAAAGRCAEGWPVRLEHPQAVFGVVFAPDGRTLYSASDDHLLRAWDVRTGREVRRFQGHAGGVLAVALTADGRTLASASRDGTVRLWETQTGRPTHALAGLRGDVEAVTLSADGSRLAASSSGRSGQFRTPFDGKAFT
jgi:WD40 repeat protein